MFSQLQTQGVSCSKRSRCKNQGLGLRRTAHGMTLQGHSWASQRFRERATRARHWESENRNWNNIASKCPRFFERGCRRATSSPARSLNELMQRRRKSNGPGTARYSNTGRLVAAVSVHIVCRQISSQAFSFSLEGCDIAPEDGARNNCEEQWSHDAVLLQLWAVRSGVWAALLCLVWLSSLLRQSSPCRRSASPLAAGAAGQGKERQARASWWC